MMILTFVVVIVISSTLALSKKRDIAIMRAIGSLPRRLYSFYLVELYIIFIIGFIVGVVLGIISFTIFSLVISFTPLTITFQWDFIYTPILFILCIAGIFFVPGYILRKIGSQKIIKNFSKDIPYNFDASKRLTFIPKWLTSIGFNFKISIINTMRKKGEFKRYISVFSIILIIIFTLGLGIIVLYNSSYEWVKKAQTENLILIGHEDVVHNYSMMYEMFQNPDIFIDNSDINFLQEEYLFNVSSLDDLDTISEIQSQEFRLINFFQTQEISGTHIYEDGGYEFVGQNRRGIFPVIGVNQSDVLQNFEIEGNFITMQGASIYYAVIGDGLAYNFFDYPFDQAIYFEELNEMFDISGVVIDSLYSGFASYIDINKFRNQMNLTANQVNLAFFQIKSATFDNIQSQLENIIHLSLGEDYTYKQMTRIFAQNLDFVLTLSYFPTILILIISIIAIIVLYNYQKAGIMEKVKDFLIMRAIGSKDKSIRKILFLEALYVIIPSLGLSLGLGMILNSLILLDRIYLPNIYVPFLLLGIIFLVFLLFNILSLFPVMKKVRQFTVKDFEMY